LAIPLAYFGNGIVKIERLPVVNTELRTQPGPPSPRPPFLPQQPGLIMVDSTEEHTIEELLVNRVVRCKSYLKTVVTGEIEKYNSTLAADEEMQLGFWIDAIALGMPGDWVNTLTSTNALLCSRIAAALARSSALSSTCVYKQSHAIWTVNETDQGALPNPRYCDIFPDEKDLETSGPGFNKCIHDIAEKDIAFCFMDCLNYQNALIQMHGSIVPGGYVFVKANEKCDGASASAALKKLLHYGARLNFDSNKSNFWFRKPALEQLDYTGLLRFLTEGTILALNDSSKMQSILNMPHSSLNYMKILALKNLAQVSGAVQFCEIGFNAGHQAIIVLASNPNAKVLSIEIEAFPWKNSTVEFIDIMFPGRFVYANANSFNSFGKQTTQPLSCDVFIMGGNGYHLQKRDLEIATQTMKPGGYIFMELSHSSQALKGAWVDKTSSPELAEIYCHTSATKVQGHQYQWCLAQLRIDGLPHQRRDIHVVTSQCGGDAIYLLELEAMIKSILLSAAPNERINLHIILDEAVDKAFKSHLEDLSSKTDG
jgi:hypothetical protein